MKKLLSFLCVLALSASMLISCSAPAQPAGPSDAPGESTGATDPATPAVTPVDIRIMAMNGPTSMGLSYFMDQADKKLLTDHNYHFSIAASPDEVVPKLMQGKLDMAAIPANLASVVYNKSQGAVQVLGINTLGVLYILETGDTIHSVEDLRGKTILATGKNHTPEQVITYLLTQNNMKIGTDVKIEWKSEAAECLNAMMQQEHAIAMLPQPFASAAQIKSGKIRVALNLTQEWDRLQKGSGHPSSLVTGVVVARKDFIARHPDAVAAFMDHYRQSVDFVNSHVDEAARLVEHYGIVKAPIARKAIPACNLVFIEGSELQTRLSGYLKVLFDQDPKSVGGKLPGNDFYYAR